MQRIPFPLARVVAVVVLATVSACSGNEPAASPSAIASPSVAPSPPPSEALDAELLDRRWTVLYIGTDLNDRREKDGHAPRADALLLATVSADQSEVALISLPRDTVDVPLPDGSVYARKINALYDEEGPEAVAAAIGELYGLPVDGYVVLDMEDFIGLVDAVDGVDVNPEQPLVDPIVDLDLEAGPQELDAVTAQAYVRTRVDQDYGRMGRQQEVMLDLVRRLTDPDREVDLAALLDSFDSLETDLPMDELATLVEVARRATDAEVERLLIQPPLIAFEGDRGDGRGYILEPDVEAIRDRVAEVVEEE